MAVTKKIPVSGSTGTVGGSALRELQRAGADLGAFCRDPDKLGAVSDSVEVVQGDLDHPDTIAPALDGVDKVLLCSSGMNVAHHEATVIERAAKAGVDHVVLVSSAGVEQGVGAGALST